MLPRAETYPRIQITKTGARPLLHSEKEAISENPTSSCDDSDTGNVQQMGPWCG